MAHPQHAQRVFGAFTNVGYLIAGLSALALPAPWSWIHLISGIGLFAGSSIYHYFKRGGILDEIGMYWVFGNLSVYHLGLDPWVCLPVSIGLTVGAIWLNNRHVLGAMAGILILSLIFAGKWLVAVEASALFALAWWFWNKDEPPVFGGFAHGMWHFLTAIMIAVLIHT